MPYKEIYEHYLKAGYLDSNPKNSALPLEDFRKNYKKHLPDDKHARILDIGCGAGQFLLFLREEGYTNFIGVDIGKGQIDFCKRYITQNVLEISDVSLYLKENREQFDLITMFNVIEHFPKNEIIEILKLASNALKRQGRLIVKTINMSCLSACFNRYIDFTHEIAFTERGLADILKVVGFSDITLYGQKASLRLSAKRLIWLTLRSLWHMILRVIFLIECGSDAPKIFTIYISAVAQKG